MNIKTIELINNENISKYIIFGCHFFLPNQNKTMNPYLLYNRVK